MSMFGITSPSVCLPLHHPPPAVLHHRQPHTYDTHTITREKKSHQNSTVSEGMEEDKE